jgi:hypothetical protein
MKEFQKIFEREWREPGIVAKSGSDKNERSANEVWLDPSWIMVAFVRDVGNQQTENGSGNQLV